MQGLTPPALAERRRDRRLILRRPSIARSAQADATAIRGVTRDISSGGLRFQTAATGVQPGDRLNLTLNLPPADGVWPADSTATCSVEVLRVRCDGPGLK